MGLEHDRIVEAACRFCISNGSRKAEAHGDLTAAVQALLDAQLPTVIDLSPRGLEGLKLMWPFTWLRRVYGFRWMHRHCGALGYWCCAGCSRDIDRMAEAIARDRRP